MGMPFIPVPNTARLDVGNVLNGLYYENVLYFFQFDAIWDAAALATLAGAVGTYYINEILPHLSSDVMFSKVVASNASEEFQPKVTIPYSSFFGGYASRSLPNHQCVYFTPQVVRRRKDPYYHLLQSGIPKDEVIGNYANLPYLLALRSAWVQLLDIVTPFSADWVVVSFRHNHQWRDEGIIKLFSNFYAPNQRIGVRAHRGRNLPF